MLTADAKLPCKPPTTAFAASVLSDTNVGNAVAARMPMITINSINSIIVEPSCIHELGCLIAHTPRLDTNASSRKAYSLR
jgi:hypothetical protein